LPIFGFLEHVFGQKSDFLKALTLLRELMSMKNKVYEHPAPLLLDDNVNEIPNFLSFNSFPPTVSIP